MFELDGEYHTKLDFGKTTSPKVAELVAMEVFLLDEFSMLDKKCFEGISEILSIIDHSRRPGVASPDPFGSVHLLLFGDFKQLPVRVSKFPPVAQKPSAAGGYARAHRLPDPPAQGLSKPLCPACVFGGTLYRYALGPQDL